MTADHLFPILEREVDSGMFVQVSSRLVVGDNRRTALNFAKPDGGVRGIVVGDSVRRLVAGTTAKQVAKKAEKATAPGPLLWLGPLGLHTTAQELQTCKFQGPGASNTKIPREDPQERKKQ